MWDCITSIVWLGLSYSLSYNISTVISIPMCSPFIFLIYVCISCFWKLHALCNTHHWNNWNNYSCQKCTVRNLFWFRSLYVREHSGLSLLVLVCCWYAVLLQIIKKKSQECVTFWFTHLYLQFIEFLCVLFCFYIKLGSRCLKEESRCWSNQKSFASQRRPWRTRNFNHSKCLHLFSVTKKKQFKFVLHKILNSVNMSLDHNKQKA